MSPFILGADPELFVVNDAGKYISSVGLFGGTKHDPKPIGNDCAIQEDNVAVEFNIPPADTAEAFAKSIQYALTDIRRRAKFHNLHLSIAASAVFDKDQLRTREAKLFGCEPDYNAWTGHSNPRPRALNRALRSSGGHVHFGWNRQSPQHNVIHMVRGADVFIGCPLSQADPDARRRLLYGKAGAFRNKPKYPGFEYRTPSNWWIANDDRVRWMFKQMSRLVEFLDNHPDCTFESEYTFVDECINNNNVEAFTVLSNKYNLEVPV